MAEAKVTLPGFGEVDRKYAVIGAIAAGGIVAVVYIRRKSKATAAASAASAGAQTDPAGNVGVIDPATGYVYGSAQDVQGGYSTYGAGTGYGGGGTVAPVTSVSGTGITTNESWLTQAISVLPGDSATIQTALADVLGGIPVTNDQKNLFMEAVGILGPPPGGYPTPIKTTDTAAQPGQTPPAPPAPVPAQRPESPIAPLPNIKGVEIWSAIGELERAGYQYGTISYNYRNVDYNQYLGHTVANYGVVPGTGNVVNIGLN